MYRTNLKLTWQLIKDLTNRGKTMTSDVTEFYDNGHKISDTVTIATKFNQYFANIGSSLAKQIPFSRTNFKTFLSGS